MCVATSRTRALISLCPILLLNLSAAKLSAQSANLPLVDGTSLSTVAPAFVTTAPAGYKDPALATLLGVLGPGWGQLYVGGDVTDLGWFAWALGYGGLSLGFAASKSPSCNDIGCTPADYRPLGYGIGWYIGVTLAAAMSAGDDARNENTKHGIQVTSITPLIQRGAEGGVNVGFALRF